MASSLFIGLMSGTSLDGVDGVVAYIPPEGTLRVLAYASQPFAPALRAELLALNQPGPDELHRAALAGNALSAAYAEVVAELLRAAGVAASDIAAIGAHGQTVRHRPGAFDGTGYTIQLGNPSLLAERTGIDVVADLRSADVAAGGQGAPLVPAFHAEVFGQRHPAPLVLNIGGISNLSVLQPSPVLGFDCGPGNVLLDLWCQRHTGAAYDAHGAWAAQGQVHAALLQRLLEEPFLALPAPKSTGRDLFHAQWLDAHLQSIPALPAVDVQATLTRFTARCCADAARPYGLGTAPILAVCGGGAFNQTLMAMLGDELPGWTVVSTDALGLPPLQVEATAFAWLAARRVRAQAGNLPAVTGASGLRTLGAWHARPLAPPSSP